MNMEELKSKEHFLNSKIVQLEKKGERLYADVIEKLKLHNGMTSDKRVSILKGHEKMLKIRISALNPYLEAFSNFKSCITCDKTIISKSETCRSCRVKKIIFGDENSNLVAFKFKTQVLIYIVTFAVLIALSFFSQTFKIYYFAKASISKAKRLNRMSRKCLVRLEVLPLEL